MKRKISPIVYSIGLWIIGLCLLLSSQYNEDIQTIVFVYMFITTPMIIFFAWQEGGIAPKELHLKRTKIITRAEGYYWVKTSRYDISSLEYEFKVWVVAEWSNNAWYFTGESDFIENNKIIEVGEKIIKT